MPSEAAATPRQGQRSWHLNAPAAGSHLVDNEPAVFLRQASHGQHGLAATTQQAQAWVKYTTELDPPGRQSTGSGHQTAAGWTG